MNFLNLNNNLIQYLFILIPLFLITGPFLPDLTLTIIGLLSIFIIYKKNYFKNISKNYFFVFFFIFCIIIIVRSIFSDNIFLSLESSLFYFRFGLFSLAVYFLISKNEKTLKYLLILFIIIYLALLFDSYYQLIFKKNIIGLMYENTQNFRITSFFGDDEVLGSYVVRFFPFLMYLCFALNIRKKNINYILISSIILCSFLIAIVSGERTALALLIISSILFLLSSKFLRKLIIPAVSIITICLFSVMQFDTRIKSRFIDQTYNQIFSNDRLTIFSEIYEGHYKIALNMFLEKPFLGHGTKIYRHYCSKPENFVSENACSTHPHNILMQFMSETGILGTSFYLIIIFGLSYFLLKNIYSLYFKQNQCLNDKFLSLVIFYFMNLFPLLPSGNFFSNWLSVIYFFPAGLYIHEYYLYKKNK